MLNQPHVIRLCHTSQSLWCDLPTVINRFNFQERLRKRKGILTASLQRTPWLPKSEERSILSTPYL